MSLKSGGISSPCGRLLPALVLLGMAATPAGANSWYFSDCANGGSGLQTDPWCITNPHSEGKKTSFAFLLDGDGVDPDVAPGDTIYLCAGPCDGSGSGTYHLEPSVLDANGKEIGFAPRIDGTAAAPITVRTLPGEQVALSGDTNGDKVYEPGELRRMISDEDVPGAAGRQYWTWKNIIFERTAGHMFNLDSDPHGWVFDGVEVRYTHPNMWSGTGGFLENNCPTDAGSHGFKVSGLTGTFTVRNSVIHHMCGFPHRALSNTAKGAAFLFENNEYYNTDWVTNDHNSHDDPVSQATVTIRGNYIHDTRSGIGIEENMRNVVIEDNVIACLGEYLVETGGRCGSAIGVSDGEGAYAPFRSRNIIVRRNKIFGTSDDHAPGWFLGGLTFSASNTEGEPIDAVIENNIIMYVQGSFSGHIFERGALDVKTPNAITVQNNTVYYSRYPMQIDGDGTTQHIVRDNLIVRGERAPTGDSSEELYVFSGGAASIFQNNNFWDYGSGATVIAIEGGNTYKCGDVGSFGTGNKCAATAFVNTAGSDPSAWDLHLASTDTANIDAGVPAAADDFDRDPRSGTPDLGADERMGGGTPLTATVGISPTPPTNTGGVRLLKAATWTITLTTSRDVATVPSPLRFTDGGGTPVAIVLAGSVPGRVFTGTLVVDASVAEGPGTFSLGADALNDGHGTTSSELSGPTTARVDRTPPAQPTGVATH